MGTYDAYFHTHFVCSSDIMFALFEKLQREVSMNAKNLILATMMAGLLLTGCDSEKLPVDTVSMNDEAAGTTDGAGVENPRFNIYSNVRLATDLSHLSDNQKQMLGLLIEAAEITNDIFWLQVWGDRDELLEGIEDPRARQFAFYNYGPWDRLAADQPFLESYGPRPPGARFYPPDMSKEEFEAWGQEGKDGLYSIVRRNEVGELHLHPLQPGICYANRRDRRPAS